MFYFLQRLLDEEAAQIAKRQDDSDASVKRLVELSKEFKRSTTEVSNWCYGTIYL